MNFIEFQLKFIKFKPKIKCIKFELHNYGLVQPSKLSRKRRHKMAWSTVSKAADKSNNTNAATSPESTAAGDQIEREEQQFLSNGPAESQTGETADDRRSRYITL